MPAVPELKKPDWKFWVWLASVAMGIGAFITVVQRNDAAVGVGPTIADRLARLELRDQQKGDDLAYIRAKIEVLLERTDPKRGRPE